MVRTMPEPQETPFVCPACRAQYKVVRVEAPPGADAEDVACVGCGAALKAREGGLVLKYFFVGPGPGRKRRKR